MLREATYPPAAVNVLDVSSESMAAFQVFLYGRFWVFTEGGPRFLKFRVPALVYVAVIFILTNADAALVLRKQVV
jgi:hypothetical protein